MGGLYNASDDYVNEHFLEVLRGQFRAREMANSICAVRIASAMSTMIRPLISAPVKSVSLPSAIISTMQLSQIGMTEPLKTNRWFGREIAKTVPHLHAASTDGTRWCAQFEHTR